MSVEQLQAFQAAIVALESAKAKSARLRKEVSYAENRAARAEAETAKLEKSVEELKRAAGAPGLPAKKTA
jgi:cell division septum initiation protein DivIVA